MSLDRILERSTLMPETWGGTNPFLSQIKCIQPGLHPGPASGLKRWMKRFHALGFTRGAKRTSLAQGGPSGLCPLALYAPALKDRARRAFLSSS
jgi:hypothetical protein